MILTTLYIIIAIILALIVYVVSTFQTRRKINKHVKIFIGLLFWFFIMYLFYGFMWSFRFDLWSYDLKMQWAKNSIMIGISFNLVKYHNI